MKLELSRRALLRLTEIAIYLDEQNPAAAADAGATIRASLDLLTQYPYAGRIVSGGIGAGKSLIGTRVLAVPRRPYLIYYRVDEPAGVVTIITIRHAKQRRSP